MRAADEKLSEEFTEDAFLGGKLSILQSSKGFRAGLDSVLLAAVVEASDKERVLDAGCGAGVAGLCLAARTGAPVTGIDSQSTAIDLAQQNAERNDLASKATFIEADVFDAAGAVGADVFDHVISNPPFHDPARERLSPDKGKAVSHAFGEGVAYRDRMAKWIKACLKTLKTKGSITLINRAAALPAMLAALDGPTGGIMVVPLQPFEGEPAKRVIVTAQKGSRSPAQLHPGVVLHKGAREFTPNIEAALRDGAALDLSS